MMTAHEAYATLSGGAGFSWAVTQAVARALRRLAHTARKLPAALSAPLRHRHRAGQHCATAAPTAAARPLPGPFEAAPQPPQAAESMTPMGPDTALHATLPYIPPPDDEERP
jgi:hypothetical protein